MRLFSMVVAQKEIRPQFVAKCNQNSDSLKLTLFEVRRCLVVGVVLCGRSSLRLLISYIHFDILPIMQTTSSTAKPPLNNCKELIRGKLQAKWEIQGDHLIVELFGRIREDEYMAFGLSGHPGRSQMVFFSFEFSSAVQLKPLLIISFDWKVLSDVVVAYYDRVSKVFRADDYYISHLAQCDGTKGVCPDERLGGQNDVIVCKYSC